MRTYEQQLFRRRMIKTLVFAIVLLIFGTYAGDWYAYHAKEVQKHLPGNPLPTIGIIAAVLIVVGLVLAALITRHRGWMIPAFIVAIVASAAGAVWYKEGVIGRNFHIPFMFLIGFALFMLILYELVRFVVSDGNQSYSGSPRIKRWASKVPMPHRSTRNSSPATSSSSATPTT